MPFGSLPNRAAGSAFKSLFSWGNGIVALNATLAHAKARRGSRRRFIMGAPQRSGERRDISHKDPSAQKEKAVRSHERERVDGPPLAHARGYRGGPRGDMLRSRLAGARR